MAYTKLGNGNRAVQLINMLNPLNHTSTEHGIEVYKGEPYVLAGDVYSHPQHVGRVGWSWYTGSASWVYRTIIENIIGLTLSGNELTFKPCVPTDWTTFSVQYQWKETYYDISFQNKEHASTGVGEVRLDNRIRKKKMVQLVNDKKTPHYSCHNVICHFLNTSDHF